MKKTFHLCQSVEGALNNWSNKTWREVIADNGIDISVAEAKRIFEVYRDEGKKVIPIGEACEGFSYETGCPGHLETRDNEVISELENIWRCGECHVDSIWPAHTGVMCPKCGKLIIPHPNATNFSP